MPEANPPNIVPTNIYNHVVYVLMFTFVGPECEIHSSGPCPHGGQDRHSALFHPTNQCTRHEWPEEFYDWGGREGDRED